MATIKIKEYEITPIIVRDSYARRALQYKNNIIELLRKIGVKEGSVDIEIETNAFKNAPASASWYMDGHRLYYSYKIAKKYVENLAIVFTVIQLEVNALLEGRKTAEEFISSFTEEDDVEESRIEARETLGVEKHVTDFNVIDAKFKDLAKKAHPDMPGGDTEQFKKINKAHKILKRELM
ncbi:MAG: J domain-containing protein [Nanoarchaeota archaeon]